MGLVRVTVDCSQIDEHKRVKPLFGLNRPPVHLQMYDIDIDEFCDYTSVYLLAGVKSVRLHASAFDVANLFRGHGEDDWTENTQFQRGLGAPQAFKDEVEAITNRSWSDFERYLSEQEYVFESIYTGIAYNQIPHPFAPGVKYRFDDQDFIRLVSDVWNIDADANSCWLYWRPVEGLADAENYEFEHTMATATYRSISSSGFEIYYRVGESWNGPSYAGPGAGPRMGLLVDGRRNYARAASTILRKLLSTPDTIPPSFLEIWKEPDGSGFGGPYDVHSFSENQPYSSDEVNRLLLWCEDFADMYRACHEQLRSQALAKIAWFPVGGVSVTSAGIKEFADGTLHPVNDGDYRKVTELYKALEAQEPACLEFFTYHLYSLDSLLDAYGGGAEGTLDPIALALATAGDLSRIHTQIKNLFGDIPVHVTEWHFAGEGGARLEFPDRITTGYSASYASSMLTWMQYPDFNIDRAYWYVGYSEGAGMFWRHDQTDDGGGATTVTEIRPAAFAMALHSTLEGDYWVPVKFERQFLPGQWFPEVDNVIEAVSQIGFGVSALATCSDDQYSRSSVILTNLSDEKQEVELVVNGLPAGDYTVKTKTISDEDFKRPITVGDWYDTTTGLPGPDGKDAEVYFQQLADIENHPGTTGHLGVLHELSTYTERIEMKPHAVHRIDFVGAEHGPAETEIVIPDAPRRKREKTLEEKITYCVPKSTLSKRLSFREYSRKHRQQIAEMRDFMEAIGYRVDILMLSIFWSFYDSRLERSAEICSEFDGFEWLAWYRERICVSEGNRAWRDGEYGSELRGKADGSAGAD
jgi:hypothetical protein